MLVGQGATFIRDEDGRFLREGNGRGGQGVGEVGAGAVGDDGRGAVPQRALLAVAVYLHLGAVSGVAAQALDARGARGLEVGDHLLGDGGLAAHDDGVRRAELGDRLGDRRGERARIGEQDGAVEGPGEAGGAQGVGPAAARDHQHGAAGVPAPKRLLGGGVVAVLAGEDGHGVGLVIAISSHRARI